MIGSLSILDCAISEQCNVVVKEPEQWVVELCSQMLNDKVSENVYMISNKVCSSKFNLGFMEGVILNRNSAMRVQQPKMGLFNLGATCYINSTLQQLFMIPPFRRAILGLNLGLGP